MCLAEFKYEGKSWKFHYFGGFGLVLGVILFLGFAISGFCDEFHMVSVPLGFEISGFEKSRNWVSQNGVFAFGFLEGCRKVDTFDGFVVGIRYNVGDKDANLPVWTVGGGLRVSENSTLRLSLDGRLILFDNPNGFIVWSSNTSNLGVKKASLLDNGNLVLMGIDDKVLWSSFSLPTNTLLPGQSLHVPQSLRAPSTKSISSYYNFVIRSSGELALVWEGNVTYWRTQLSSNAVIREARFNFDGALVMVDENNGTSWSIRSEDYGDNSVNLRHLRIDSDGNLRIYSWDSLLHSWRVRWQAVENQCNVFGSCGLYSLCRFNSTGPVCDCLNRDLVSSSSDSDLSAAGLSGSSCSKMVDLSSCKMKTSMWPLKQTVLYGLYPPGDVDMMLSQEACKEYCSKDSTCIAVTSKNDGSGVCTVKRTSFISGYRNPSVPSFSFLKVCSVPQAAIGAKPFNRFKPVALVYAGLGTKKAIKAITFVVLVTGMCFVAVEMLVFSYVYWKRKVKVRTRLPFGKDTQMSSHYRLSLDEVKELTGNFSTQLGPSIFKGEFPNKIPVIAKVLESVAATEKDFRVAVSTLGGMHHRNLVPLKGFCFEPELKCLLYEYVPNGSLNQWLFKNEGNWQQKLDIAIGVARALAYLHTECQESVAHGNLKLENALLDENAIPKLTDYGLGRLKGEETASSSSSPHERDIYMLGEMLLQIVTGKRDVLGRDLESLLTMMNEELKLQDFEDTERVERAVTIALWCMQTQPFLRPSIGEVVKVLEGSLSVDRPPSTANFRQDIEERTLHIDSD